MTKEKDIIEFTEEKGFCFKERSVIFNETSCLKALNKEELSEQDQKGCLYLLYIHFANKEKLLKSRENQGDCNIKMDKSIVNIYYYVNPVTEKLKNTISDDFFDQCIYQLEEICHLNNSWRMTSEINKKDKIVSLLKINLGLSDSEIIYKKPESSLAFRI